MPAKAYLVGFLKNNNSSAELIKVGIYSEKSPTIVLMEHFPIVLLEAEGVNYKEASDKLKNAESLLKNLIVSI